MIISHGVYGKWRMRQFEDKVRRMHESGEFFDRVEPVYVGRAPGRMDLMGGNVDYTGGLVFEMPIREATWAGAQLRDDSRIVLRNPQMRDRRFPRESPSDAEFGPPIRIRPAL